MSFKIARIIYKTRGKIFPRVFGGYGRNTYATSSKDDKCDCTPDEYDYEPEYTIQKTPVIEKKCEPCSFLCWKPKEPKLMDAKKSHLKKKEKKEKKRTIKECFPEMVLEDNCPAKTKRTPPKWNEVFPNNVCKFKCKSKLEQEKEKAAAKLEQQIKRKRRKRENPRIPCPGPDWDHSGKFE